MTEPNILTLDGSVILPCSVSCVVVCCDNVSGSSAASDQTKAVRVTCSRQCTGLSLSCQHHTTTFLLSVSPLCPSLYRSPGKLWRCRDPPRLTSCRYSRDSGLLSVTKCVLTVGRRTRPGLLSPTASSSVSTAAGFTGEREREFYTAHVTLTVTLQVPRGPPDLHQVD